ncbi:SHQ1-domain-containing protein [Metschnikowia bicuspidata var. bicuspidata NRRL YB-4993]|uniref:SHQ1-domain-containing protein n=1 Tax=Metschnikowia bicuspidata var. bicuspidata NRRL YB-4993 TaxID=869754 RepID=A0A1A0HFZ0_9ASCO|nr:SHQ1-domain-containing protein [Metschnikowia bicuspidata var. bicuspidata NRRL YB-4993]OBA22900.1 SHQ1-domain-containing protein [Metschnikowia bicuspidata var. bicuspidata NRRL YB-4993]
MITPYFTVDQDEEYLYVSVKVSHIRFSAQSIEMVANGDVFVFSLPPYYLRLRLPFPVLDDERAKAEFDLKSSNVNISLPKEVKGQFFPDLDLTAKLLARKDEASVLLHRKPLIEELDISRNMSFEDVEPKNLELLADEGQTYEWELSQEINTQQASGATYGFNNSYSQIVGISLASGNDINELSDPESSLAPDRIIERLIKENIKFDPEYYAADFIMEKNPSEDNDKVYAGIMKWKSPTTRQFLSWYKQQQQATQEERELVVKIEFSKEENERMFELPKKSYLLEDSYRPQLWMLLITLLFAHQFDLRENEGEHNIESAWTIGKLTPQFAYLDSQIFMPDDLSSNILEATILTVSRRSLCYPFHRHYGLTKKAWDDVYYILRSGRRVVLKCLLEVRELFRFHDVYYVYDKIWLEDLCLWILSDLVSENALRHLAHDLKRKIESLKKTSITFEKVDDTQTGDAMIVLDIEEIVIMAEDSYNTFTSQNE